MCKSKMGKLVLWNLTQEIAIQQGGKYRALFAADQGGLLWL